MSKLGFKFQKSQKSKTKTVNLYKGLDHKFFGFSKTLEVSFFSPIFGVVIWI